MAKDGDSARKEAVNCMALAAKSPGEERSAVLRDLARTWMTLANQMDRLEAINVQVKLGAQPGLKPRPEKNSKDISLRN